MSSPTCTRLSPPPEPSLGESLSDEQLVALLRQGQESAFDILAGRYHARLLAFCWRTLRSKEDAEDVLQDVLTAAFRAIVADEREIHVRPWLYRIARNRCINELRRAKAVGVDSIDEFPALSAGATADGAASRQRLGELVTDLQALPRTQRTALLLREFDGLAYGQIAAAMETTVPAVKSLLVRARTGLRDSSVVRSAAMNAPPARGARTAAAAHAQMYARASRAAPARRRSRRLAAHAPIEAGPYE